MGKDKDEKLEPTEAIPQEIPIESTYSMALRKEGTSSDDPNRDEFGDADTDRFDLVERAGALAIASKLPTQLIFTLRNIRSLNAACFFCKKMDCDQIFMSRSLVPNKTRAYAVHSVCVFDHGQLQDLPSEGL
jgi:hypothetical protein